MRVNYKNVFKRGSKVRVRVTERVRVRVSVKVRVRVWVKESSRVNVLG